MVIEDCVFVGNSAEAGSGGLSGGGALALDAPTGVATITGSSFSFNEGERGASVMWAGRSDSTSGPVQVLIEDSVLHHNGVTVGSAAIVGGGTAGSLVLRNTTLAHNIAATTPVLLALPQFGTVEMVQSTIARNLAASLGGSAVSLLGAGTSLSLSRSVIAGNTVAIPGGSISPDISLALSSGSFPDFVSAGYNVVGSASGNTAANSTLLSAGLVQTGDVFGTNASPFDPELAELADYGGPTLTMPPHPTSPLVDAIPGGSNVLATDQRLLARPQGTASDIGAVELPRVAFTTWNTQIPDSTQRAATADPDGDSLVNGLEYYLGTDPNAPSVSPVRIVSDETGTHLEVVRSAQIRPAFFRIEQVESSPTLTDAVWTVFDATPTVTPAVAGSLDLLAFRYPLELGGDPAIFYRVRAE